MRSGTMPSLIHHTESRDRPATAQDANGGPLSERTGNKVRNKILPLLHRSAHRPRHASLLHAFPNGPTPVKHLPGLFCKVSARFVPALMARLKACPFQNGGFVGRRKKRDGGVPSLFSFELKYSDSSILVQTALLGGHGLLGRRIGNGQMNACLGPL